MIDQHQGQHGFGDGRGADADAGIVAAQGRTMTGSLARLTDWRSTRMLDVGLIASDTVTGWPVEMPPTPPALLLRKPSA